VICTIGVGSNLGDRRSQLEFAASRLAQITKRPPRVSPIYSTPALLPENGPASWRIPFLNAVIEVEWHGTAHDLFHALKSVEREAGRTPGERWAPRPLDLDLLFFGDEVIQTPELTVPHASYASRAFVLDPLKDLRPSFTRKARQLTEHSPLWMGILNLTPDSFSADGWLAKAPSLMDRIHELNAAGVQILDSHPAPVA
jgi:2-amino-4-hydroxy-6-hydroxymethyldihydropteridine diphosphokinase